MKKIILILMFCMLMAETARAECWGAVVNGKNGHSYCVSNQMLDWYASLGWCASQGRHLASINEACDYGTNVYGTTAEGCSNMEFSSGVYFDGSGNDMLGRSVWTATIDSGDDAFVVDLGYYRLNSVGYTHWRRNKGNHRAFCY